MKNIEVAYLFAAYAMAGIMFYATKHKKFPTFSHVALGHKVARQAFFWGLLTAGLLFLSLMHEWFIPHFRLGSAFSALVLILVISQVLTGFFPVEHKKLSRLHVIFGSIMAVCMFTLIIVLASTSTVHSVVRVLDALIAISMVCLAATIKWTMKSTKELLFHEFIFFGLWHFSILITTYFG